jgi:outer membrane protein assembly factor BamB
VVDSSTSSPVVTQDGVLYGTFTGYNGFRGHLMKFDPQGVFQHSYDFGWDVTPAVWPHDGTYSVLLKDNAYFLDRFFLTQLSPLMQQEWSLEATNQDACFRDETGVHCNTLPGERFEWCINAPAVDREGTVHVLSEDGNLYAIRQGGVQKGKLFTHLSLPSGYTPVVLDGEGRIYAMNDGYVTVIGR